jgi:uridine kinase
MEPILVGICGGSASGKTSLCRKVAEGLGVDCTVLEMDHFYRGLTPEQIQSVSEYNFDHPEALNFDDIFVALNTLLEGKDAEIPVYDFKKHSRAPYKQTIKSNKLILYEGIFSLFDPKVRDMMKLKIFVQTDDDLRLSRRLLRDTQERGRDLDGVLYQYFRFVKPSYDEYIRPTMKYADIIIPQGAHNQVAIDLILLSLRNYLS